MSALSAIQLPQRADPQSLYLWAVSLVNVLRQKGILDANDLADIQASADAAIAASNDNAAAIGGLETDFGGLSTDLGALSSVVGGLSSDWNEQRKFELSLMTATSSALGSAGEIAYDAMVWAQQNAEAATLARLRNAYNETGIRVEQTVRASADSAFAQQIETINASVASTNAAIVTEQTTRANGDAANATSISTVSTTVAGHTSSISTISGSVDGLKAQWGVVVSANGQVTGLVRLDSGATGSQFVVVADKFIVAMPGAPATTAAPFIVGAVNGVSTVGINGYLVVDGSIVARHILAGSITADRILANSLGAGQIAAGSITADRLSVSSLSSVTANIGTINAGLLQREDATMVVNLNSKIIRITT